jgi:hypothetical protein
MPAIASFTLSLVVPDGGGVGATRSSTSPTVLVTGEGAGGVAALEISLTVLVTRRVVRVPTLLLAGELPPPLPATGEEPLPLPLGEGEAVPEPAVELPPPPVGAGVGEVLEGC